MATSENKYSAEIIVVSFYSNLDLQRCLPELHRTTTGYSVTIVDNAAPDQDIDWIETQYPTWKLVRNPANLGFGEANNFAVKSSDSEYLVFLNPDTVPLDGWVDALIAPLEADPNVGMTTGKIILLSDPQKLNTVGNSVHLTGITTCRGIRAPRDSYAEEENIGAVSGACFAMRRELFNSLCGFDETFFLYMEDTDLSLRVIMNGYQIRYVPTAQVYHDYELKFVNKKIFYQERNRYLMLFKLLRWRTMLLMIPIFIFAEIITWGFAFQSEKSNISNKLSAYWWIIRNWRSIIRLRREVQLTRKIDDRVLINYWDSRLDITQFGRTPILVFAEFSVAKLTAIYKWFMMRLIRW